MAAYSSPLVIGVLLALGALATATPTHPLDTHGAVMMRDELSVSTRFFFSKQCETMKKDGREEECCSGNFSCKEKVCDGKGVCKGFLKNFLWCSARQCKPKNAKPSPSASKFEEMDEIAESAEPDEPGILPSEAPVYKDPTPSPSRTPAPSPSTSARPSMQPSPLPSPPPSPPPKQPAQFNPLNCDGSFRRRRDIRDLAKWEVDRWVRAIQAVMKVPSDNSLSEWEELVQHHQTFGDEAHGGCYFLPWHRLFLLQLENLMRRHEPDVTLPYWDWTRDSQDAAMSTLWKTEYCGGAHRNDQPIPDGPFAWMSTRTPQWHTVRRNFESGTSGSMQPLWGWNSLENVLNNANWSDFADGIESAHILPHIAIGGDMTSTHHAPNDPVFYLHHAYVDFLWSLRQERAGRYQFGGTHDFATGTVQCDAGMVFGAFGVPARNAFDVWCVQYVPPVIVGSNAGFSGRTAQAAKLRCDDAEFLNKTGLTAERCRHGSSVLA